MTLPASGSISTDQILAELRLANAGRNYPLSLDDPDVLSLAAKTAPPVVMPDDFYGKSAAPPTQPLYAEGQSASGRDFNSSLQGGTAFAEPAVLPEGGDGNYTYLWSFTDNPDGCTLTKATQISCRVSKIYARNSFGYATAYLQCIVRDKGGQGSTFIVEDVEAYLEWNE